jgi:hypothetical protein
MRHDQPPLPKLHDVVLDEEGVDRLFEEIAREGRDVVLLFKGDVQTHAAPGAADLADARELLRAGTVYGVQIRYRRGDEAWLDTLMHVPHGVRLVRIAQQGA